MMLTGLNGAWQHATYFRRFRCLINIMRGVAILNLMAYIIQQYPNKKEKCNGLPAAIGEGESSE